MVMTELTFPTGRTATHRNAWSAGVKNRLATARRIRQLRSQLAMHPDDLAAAGRNPHELLAEIHILRDGHRSVF